MTDTPNPIPPLPPLVRYVVAGVSAVVLASALAAAVACALAPTPIWVMFGFEVVIALAGVIGLLGVKGRFDEGQAMWLLCIAGTLFVAGFLAYLATRGGVQLRTGGPTHATLAWSVSRLGAAGLFGLLAVYSVLRRTAQGRAFFVRGLVLLAVLGGVLSPFAVARGMPGFVAQMAGPIRGGVLTVVGIVVVVLACAAGHALIRAFESARSEPRR